MRETVLSTTTERRANVVHRTLARASQSYPKTTTRVILLMQATVAISIGSGIAMALGFK